MPIYPVLSQVFAAIPTGVWSAQGVVDTYYGDSGHDAPGVEGEPSPQDVMAAASAAVEIDVPEFVEGIGPSRLEPSNAAQSLSWGAGGAAPGDGGHPRSVRWLASPPALPTGGGGKGRPIGRTWVELIALMPDEFPQGVKTSEPHIGPDKTPEALLRILLKDPSFLPLGRIFLQRFSDGMDANNLHLGLIERLLREGPGALPTIQSVLAGTAGGQTPGPGPMPTPGSEQVFKAIEFFAQRRAENEGRHRRLKDAAGAGVHVPLFEAEPDYELDTRDVVADVFYSQGGAGRMGLTLGTSVRHMNCPLLRDHILVGMGIVNGVTGWQRGFVHEKKGRPGERVVLMGFRDRARDFDRLRGVEITRQAVRIGVDFPISLTSLHELLVDQKNDLHSELVRSTATEGIQQSVVVKLSGRTIVTISPNIISVPYAELGDDPTLMVRAIYLATRILETLHQDRIWSEDFKFVDMTSFRPICDALFGIDNRGEFRSLGAFLWQHRAELTRQDGPFRETHKSRAARLAAVRAKTSAPPAQFMLRREVQPYPALVQKYVLVKEGDPPVAVMDLEMNFKEQEARTVLGRVAPTLEMRERRVQLRQHGSARPVIKTLYDIVATGGGGERTILTLSRNDATIPLEREEDVEQAMLILDLFVTEGTFETVTATVRGVRAGLTPDEHQMLTPINLLISLYNMFIRYILNQRLFAGPAAELRTRTGQPLPDPPEPVEWLVEVIRHSPAQTPEGRLLNALRVIHGMIDPSLPVFRGSDAQERYRQLETSIAAIKKLLAGP